MAATCVMVRVRLRLRLKIRTPCRWPRVVVGELRVCGAASARTATNAQRAARMLL